MPLYHYKARDTAGKIIEGDRDAKNQYDLAKTLRIEGLTPLIITETSASARKKTLDDYLPAFLCRISLEDKLNFTRNTGVMIGAGVSLSKSLEVMSHQAKNKKFADIILQIGNEIKKGRPFADAIGEHKSIFPKFYQEMVRAGEKSGKLEESLQLITLQLKKDYALRRKIRSAMIYPIVIMVAMIAIGILMLIYVVPTLIATFEELDVPLPASTRFIIFISQSLLKSGIVILIGAVVLGFALIKYFKSAIGKKMLDWVFTHAPVIKGISQKFNSARMCRTLSSLLSAGIDILEAMEITRDVIQNHYYQNVLTEARAKIQKGENISKSFLVAGTLYPPIVGEMIAVGEETGQLSKMLLRLASFYESEVAAATKDLSTVIEPALMVLMGIAVGFFAVSMISPMYNLAGSF